MNTPTQYTEEELKVFDAEWEQVQQDQDADYEKSVSANYANRGQANIY